MVNSIELLVSIKGLVEFLLNNQMKSFVASALAGIAAARSAVDIKFIQHVVRHNLSYGTVEEFDFRKARFTEVENYINE